MEVPPLTADARAAVAAGRAGDANALPDGKHGAKA